jgi:hypothetical protein
MAVLKKGKTYPDPRTIDESTQTPEEYGQESISGHMTAPNRDDSVIDNVHEVGLYEKADEENPQELGIGDEIDEMERKQ